MAKRSVKQVINLELPYYSTSMCSQLFQDLAHNYIIHVIPITSGCSEGDIRLVGGAVYYEGRVEICLGGVWGTVCDDNWEVQEAAVACRRLGFMDSGKNVGLQLRHVLQWYQIRE